MSRRESVDEKWSRYLAEGRPTVVRAGNGRGIVATCHGPGEIHRLGYDVNHGWSCTCMARGRCSHLAALQRVVIVDRTPHPAFVVSVSSASR